MLGQNKPLPEHSSLATTHLFSANQTTDGNQNKITQQEYNTENRTKKPNCSKQPVSCTPDIWTWTQEYSLFFSFICPNKKMKYLHFRPTTTD